MSLSSEHRVRNTQRSQQSDDLLVAPNFIRAVRDSGYASLSTALAELIDNSLQASASTVAVSIERANADAWPEIRVEDDGRGMARIELEACLRFGGTGRFDDRGSFGRFGMGLPAASLSQARRIEVTAWTPASRPLEVVLDVDEVSRSGRASLRARRSPIEPTTPSGCRVHWRLCDRIAYRRLAWLERALHRDLGRMYRRFLRSGLTLTINGSLVKPVDPLLLAPALEGHAARLAFEPLQYELSAPSGQPSFVRVRFSVLPVDAWNHLDNVTKRRSGIVGGGGVSVVRAGREIAYGWHLMGGKRKENYDDWWRCEIEFDPVLDEHFGITINKQGILPSAELREALESELESIARLLNARVRQAFEDIKFQAAAQASCRVAETADVDLPVIATRGRGKAQGGLSYRIKTDRLPTETMFSTSLRQRTVEVTLNVDHPAFTALYGPLQSMTEDAGRLRTAVELLVLSFARTSALLDQKRRLPDDLLAHWSSAYGRMLQKS
ncbi:ATP-binding protein [Actinopolymorpha pittospori]